MIGKICNIRVIIEGSRWNNSIALAPPPEGGNTTRQDDSTLMVYGSAVGTSEDNRWHFFPLCNVEKYSIADGGTLRSHAADCPQRMGQECTCGAFEHNEKIYGK